MFKQFGTCLECRLSKWWLRQIIPTTKACDYNDWGVLDVCLREMVLGIDGGCGVEAIQVHDKERFISLFLFNMTDDAMSRILNKEKPLSLFKGQRKGKERKGNEKREIVHLQFADDALFSIQAHERF